jgi:tripartite-type tricarboxylate transporter receptor subunit TctC
MFVQTAVKIKSKNVHSGWYQAATGSALVLLCTLWVVPAAAQSYPARSVRVIVPYPAGGSLDLIGRVYASRLSDALGQPFIVDNRGGANGNVGTEAAANAAPDGYTLVVTSSSNLTINPNIYLRMAFDVQRDLAPVSLVAVQRNVLVVYPSLPVRSVKELVALAKAKPGSINYGSSGIGSSAHMSAELFRLVTGAQMTHVPYKGVGPATNDLVAGQIPLMFNNLAVSTPFVKSGRLRALAVTGSGRHPSLPEVPSMAQAGYPGVDVSLWEALLAPAATPPDIVARLNSELIKAALHPEVRDRLASAGADPSTGTPQQLAQMIRGETAKWAKVVREAKIAQE